MACCAMSWNDWLVWGAKGIIIINRLDLGSDVHGHNELDTLVYEKIFIRLVD